MTDLAAGVPGVNAPDPTTYEEFWPYYVSQHLEPATRTMHAVGTSVALVIGTLGILRRRARLVALAPIVGYGFAWAAHLGFEKNKPATLGNPLWSFRGDLELLRRSVAGEMDEEVAKVRAALAAGDGHGGAAARSAA